MKKILKYILLGFIYLIGAAILIVFSPIILLVLFVQFITQPFEKKKFFSSGFDKFAAYSWGITNTLTYGIYKIVKPYKFELIINAFAGLDLYIFEKEGAVNFVLCGDFDETFYFSGDDNEWIYFPQHRDCKNAKGEEQDCVNVFEEMRAIKELKYSGTEKAVNSFICVYGGFEKSLSKCDKLRFSKDKRFIPLSEAINLVCWDEFARYAAAAAHAERIKKG